MNDGGRSDRRNTPEPETSAALSGELGVGDDLDLLPPDDDQPTMVDSQSPLERLLSEAEERVEEAPLLPFDGNDVSEEDVDLDSLLARAASHPPRAEQPAPQPAQPSGEMPTRGRAATMMGIGPMDDDQADSSSASASDGRPIQPSPTGPYPRTEAFASPNGSSGRRAGQADDAPIQAVPTGPQQPNAPIQAVPTGPQQPNAPIQAVPTGPQQPGTTPPPAGHLDPMAYQATLPGNLQAPVPAPSGSQDAATAATLVSTSSKEPQIRRRPKSSASTPAPRPEPTPAAAPSRAAPQAPAPLRPPAQAPPGQGAPTPAGPAPAPSNGPSNLVLAVLWIMALASVAVAVVLYATRG